MERGMKGSQPRISPMLRFAFMLMAIFPFVPLLFVLATYDLIPGVEYIGPPPSSVELTVGIISGLIFVALIGIAATGWNPLYRLEVAAARMVRTDLETLSVDASKPPMLQRIAVTVSLVVGFLAINWLLSEGIVRGVRALFR
jgi:hypothetical protein